MTWASEGGGTPGADGKTWLSGTAAPTTEGVNGDFYFRTTTKMIYGPKAAGVWPAGVQLLIVAGTLTEGAVATIVSGVPTWVAP